MLPILYLRKHMNSAQVVMVVMERVGQSAVTIFAAVSGVNYGTK